jgi:hypothetical protein
MLTTHLRIMLKISTPESSPIQVDASVSTQTHADRGNIALRVLTEKANVVVRLKIYTREISDSNLDRIADHPDIYFLYFIFSYSPSEWRDSMPTL